MTNGKKKPNLVFVAADALPYCRLGFGGDPLAKTPSLDRLSRTGLNMTNACVSHPLGCPFRASLFTGKHTMDTGMAINALRLNPEHRFFAQILTGHGYSSEFIGKWNLYAAKLGASHTVKESFIPPGEYRFGFDGYFAAYDYHRSNYAPEAYYHLDSPERRFPLGFEPDYQTDLTIERLKKHAADQTPFALFLLYGAPHDPWDRPNVPAKYYDAFAGTEFAPPPNYAPKNDPHADAWSRLKKADRQTLPEQLRCYYALTAAVDANAGRLLDALDETGLSDDTLFVFTSAHGELFGAHGRRGKNVFYDEAVHVPLLLRFGSRLPAGENATPLSTVDLMPTLLSLLGIDDRGEGSGKDLSAEILTGSFTDRACLLTGTGPACVWGNGREWRAVRTARHTYAVYRSEKQGRLFDNVSDPLQQTDLSGEESQKETLAAMKRALSEEMVRVGDGFEPNSYYKKNRVRSRVILSAKPGQ